MTHALKLGPRNYNYFNPGGWSSWLGSQSQGACTGLD